jgi:uncharacterized protein YjiS (DUF1127 family)
MTTRTSFETLRVSWRRWRLRSRTREELSWLSDRQRADIGRPRTDIGLLGGLARRG